VYIMTVLYPQPRDRQAFRAYYAGTHVPLVTKLPGLRAYRYAFDISSPQGASPYFCIFEAEFDDRWAVMSAMASTEAQALAADVPNYSPAGATMLMFEVHDRGELIPSVAS
jgi:uncharacterized protein (TIGR02118 family)